MAITKRGKTWQARISFKNADGKYRRVTKGGFKTKKEAQLYVSEFKVNPANGKFENSQPLFYEYFWNWFETFKEKTITSRTKRQYVHTYNILKKFFPSTELENMDRSAYQKFLDDYGSNHAKETVTKLNALVHASVKDALYDGKIKKDFIQRTNIVFDKSRTWKIEYLNESEMDMLVDYLIET